jgi:sec-independent protein translocase protein TatC
MSSGLPDNLPGTQDSSSFVINGEDESPLAPYLVAAKRVLFISLGLFAVTFVIVWIFREELTILVRWPLVKAFPNHGADTILLTIIDSFMMHIKLCFFTALAILAPYWLWIIWKAIRSKQQADVNRISPLLLIGMIVLFYAGVAFAYVIALPAAFEFLVGYSMAGEGIIFASQATESANFLQVSMREHITFTMKLLLAFGIGFEAPVIMLLLARTGLVSPQTFVEKRGIAIVVLAVVSATLTPPDPWTMVILLVPLYILYEFGILLSKAIVRPHEGENP